MKLRFLLKRTARHSLIFSLVYMCISHMILAQPPLEQWPAIGMNLEWQELQKWSRTIPFNNLLKIADPFRDASTYDVNGYPLSGFPSTSDVYIGENLPVGSYKVRWDGQGNFTINVGGQVNTFSGSCPTDGHDIMISNPLASVSIQINSTNSADHLRNMRMYLPGYDDQSPNQFNDCYLDLFKSPIDVVRTMWWAMVPSSTIQNWDDRPTLTDYSYGGDDDSIYHGAAYEHMIDLANETSSDLWICIPVMANDNFVSQLAMLIRTRLNHNLNVYVEYSNESTWNYWFEYHNSQSLVDVGLVGYPGDDGDIYVQHKYAARTIQILEIFDNVFTNEQDRLIGVLGCQFGYFAPTADMVDAIQWLDKLNLIDAFAIAPYVGESELVTNHWPDMNAIFDAMDQFAVDMMNGNALPGPSNDKGDSITAFYDFAETHQKRVLAYESGQHFVTTGIGGIGGNLTGEQVAAVNNHARMYQWYQIYANAWYSQSITATNVFYTSSAPCSSELQSCFGMVTSCDQPLEDAHKFRGLLDWANNTIVGLEENEFLSESSVNIYPNPALNEFKISGEFDFYTVEIFDSLGKLYQTINQVSHSSRINILSLPPGLYFVRFSNPNNHRIEIKKIIKQ